MKILVLLSGSGVYDGSEIHESVFTLLALDGIGASVQCIAPDKDQYHVINHLNGEVMQEKRNVLVESARIARGDIKAITQVNVDDFDALVIPGGFGAAKNLNQWAIQGAEGEIDEQVKSLILKIVEQKKPIVALCMGPTVLAKALEGSGLQATLTVGSDTGKSPYDIAGISDGMRSIGVKPEMKTINEISVDREHKFITAPCYMMQASITEVYNNAKMAIEKLKELI